MRLTIKHGRDVLARDRGFCHAFNWGVHHTRGALDSTGPRLCLRNRYLMAFKNDTWSYLRADAARLVGSADVVTLTLRWEGAPYALLEAMTWSRPVVATGVNGCPEVVVEGEPGYLVPPGDASAWAKAVTRLLGDPSHADALALPAHRRVESQYSLVQMIARLDALYRSPSLQTGW